MSSTQSSRPPLPPFTWNTAVQKVRMAEDAWNSRDPERVSLAYSADSSWRNREEFLSGREAIVEFLRHKWAKELDYRLIKELWTFHETRIAVRFAYEWHDNSGNWIRFLRQQKLGVRRNRPHAPAHCKHQRPVHQGIGSKVSLGIGPTPR